MLGNRIFHIALACLIPLSAATGSPYASRRIPKVLIIGIEGLHADALSPSNTPVLDSLMHAGVHSYQTLSDSNARKGPGWASLLTGVAPDFHGVRNDGILETKRVLYPNVFDHLKNSLPGIRTAAVVAWEPMGRNLLYNADTLLVPGSDWKVEAEAIRLLSEKNPDALFLHFRSPEQVGRIFGFNPKMPFYRWTVGEADQRSGRILRALRNRHGYKKENWLIIVASIHGGDSPRKDVRDIPDREGLFLAAAPGLESRDLGTEAGILDVVPTVLYHFSILHQQHFAFPGQPAQESRESKIEAYVFDGSYILQ